MNTTAPEAIKVAEQYIAVWNETDDARRLKLLETHWADDARYVDPIAQASGRTQINALVGGVHQRYPGFRFALRGRVDGHGDRLRFSWTFGPTGAEDMIEGTDFVELESGRLQSVTGFLDKAPVAA